MVDEKQVQQLLDEMLENGRTPEEVCGTSPDLLAEVNKRWRQLCQVEAKIDAIFPRPTVVSHAGVTMRSSEDVTQARIPGYDMAEILGRGGMGIVFRAMHLKLKRVVALKMLLAGAQAGPQELARFQREAEAVAALHHPHIVQVYEVGQLDGQPYFTMEFMEGGSLAQQLGRTRPQPRQAAELVATLASAVQFAHQSGIIHRDLKPSNILLATDGAPKIADFGLARFIDQGPELTGNGVRLGTPSYMAPEQALGKASVIGPSVDIYALGVILYEALTGRLPFAGESAADIERQVIAEEPVPPSRVNGTVPRDLETICLKCLQKTPSRRYTSAQDLADDLHRFLKGHPVLARPVGKLQRAVKWARRRPTLAALLFSLMFMLTAALGIGLWLEQQRNSHQQAARQAIQSAIPRAYELARAEQWQDAGKVLADATRQLPHADSDELGKTIARAKAEIHFAEQLEIIRQGHAPSLTNSVNGRRLYQDFAKSYARAFAQAKIDIDDVEGTAAALRASEVRLQLVAALELWAVDAFQEKHDALLARLLRIAKLADPDPLWHDRFRDPALWQNPLHLRKLAGDAAKLTKPPAAHQLAIVGLLLGRVGAHSERVSLLQAALKRHPGDYWLNWEMGIALLDGRQFPEAVTYFRIVAALRPDNPWALCHLSGALQGAGRFEEALATSRRAVELAPDSPVLRHNLAVDLLVLKQFDEAEKECRYIVQAEPTNADYLYALGATLVLCGRNAEALPILRKVIELAPNHFQAWYSLGLESFNSGQIDEAAEAFAKVVKFRPTFFLGHFGLARTCLLQGKYQQAVAEHRWLLWELQRDKMALVNERKFDPEIMYANVWQGMAEALCCLGRFGEAQAAAQRAIELPGTDAAQRQALRLRLERCKQLIPVEGTLPAMLAANKLPPDPATQRALAEWLSKDKQLPHASALIYKALLAGQPPLADDLESRLRFDAACAAALAGCSQGQDTAKLDETVKAQWRKQALDWLAADLAARTRQHNAATIRDKVKAAAAMRSWQQSKELAGLRKQEALARLPESERLPWQKLWHDVQALASADPQPLFLEARASIRQKDWGKAAAAYTKLFRQFPANDGELWVECAAVQLLAGDWEGYRQTCKYLLEGSPQNPRIRPYYLARVCTLAPDSVDNPELPALVSARELKQFTTDFWSLTEQGALCYRAKKYKEAVTLLQWSLRAEPQPGAAVLNWLWLALAYHQLGETEEARRWLEHATGWLDSLGSEMPANGSAQRLDYHNWLEAHILRKEAEALLK